NVGATLMSGPAPHRALHSFPTRRSSDLLAAGPERELEHALAEHPTGVGEQQDDRVGRGLEQLDDLIVVIALRARLQAHAAAVLRSEEHTSELQSRENLVCRLRREKKKRR